LSVERPSWRNPVPTPRGTQGRPTTGRRRAALGAKRLIHWSDAPAARACHPREEHLLPQMVVVGAADGAAGAHSCRAAIGGKVISAFRFG
jgi:hypothetical protein